MQAVYLHMYVFASGQRSGFMNFLHLFQQHFWGALFSIWLVAGYLVPMMVLEVAFPAHKLHWRTTAFNLLYAPVYLTLAGLLVNPLTHQMSQWIPLNVLGVHMETLSWWLLVPALMAYLAAFDFFYYWLHRAQHRWPWLWRYHLLHHTDPNVSVTTATRHHWVEESARLLVLGVPLLILVGNPGSVLPWLGILVGVYGLFIHWNMPLQLGFLTRVMVGPQYHRVHHSLATEHFDKNFAVYFPFWDALFGTQWLPAAGQFPETGVPGTVQPNSLKLILPFPPKST